MQRTLLNWKLFSKVEVDSYFFILGNFPPNAKLSNPLLPPP